MNPWPPELTGRRPVLHAAILTAYTLAMAALAAGARLSRRRKGRRP